MEDKEYENMKKNNPEFCKLFNLLNNFTSYNYYSGGYKWNIVKYYPYNKEKIVIVKYCITHNISSYYTGKKYYTNIDRIFIENTILDKTISYSFTIIQAINYIKDEFKHQLRHIKINKLLDNIPSNP